MAFDSHCMQMYAMVKSMTKNLPDRKQIYLTESKSTWQKANLPDSTGSNSTNYHMYATWNSSYM